MPRSRRPFAWSLVLALLCALVVTAEKPQTARAAAQTFIVTKTEDTFSDPSDNCTATPSNCTLREALNSANDPANAGSMIEFEIPTSDPGFTNFPPGSPDAWIITPTLALPPILQDGTIIDGSTQTNRVGNTNNDGAEIIIDGANVTNAGGLWIQSNGNTVRGIGIINFRADGVPGTLKGVGIEISGNNNTIQGNYIGLGVAPSGTVAVPNIDAGIIIYGQNNLIGGDNTALTTQFNVISGNSGDGILVNGGDNNNIAGNYIGTNGAVSSAIPNGGNGINLRNGANGNTIGNFQAASVVSYRNFIGGNSGYGILIKDSLNNKIYGNFIGLNRAGISKISNGLGGIRIDGTSTNSSTGNIIGATTPSPTYMRNYIAGNAGPGIQLNSFGARLNMIVSNYIGVGSNSAVPGPVGSTRLSVGILIDGGASDNTVGGSIAGGAHNIIAGISGDGIRVAGLLVTRQNIARARNNVVSGNYIGVAPNGTTALANTGSGIVLENYVVNATVGGTAADQRNLIANNGADGIAVRGTSVQTTTIQKNTIRSNAGDGIDVANALNTRVDGSDAAGANQITSNGGNGILVTNSLTTTIRFNTANLNALNGTRISGSSRYTTINSNTLNTNSQNGIRVDGVSLDTAITSNTIYTNTLKGVVVSDVGTQRVKIVDNSMTGNATGGIDLTPETGGAPGNSGNANHDIDPPVDLRINQAGVLTGRVLVGDNPAACKGCSIQIFSANPQTLDGQGRDKLPVTPPVDANGKFTANLGTIPAQLAITATDQNGNTSEFAVFTRKFGLAIVPKEQGMSAFPGDVITYTHQLVNNGTVDFTNVQLTATSSLGWGLRLLPPSPVTVLAGRSVPITLTLTLPTGSALNVREGLKDTAIITASATTLSPAVTTTAVATDTTTVLGKFILAVDPLTRNGIGLPNTPVDYTHTLTNIGNKPGTVNASAVTDLGWTTSVTPTLIALQPGQSAGITARVLVPQGAQKDTVAVTTVTLTASDISQSRTLTDTTTVALEPLAMMLPAEDSGSAAACEKISFRHTVTNQSNGTATFRLAGSSSLGSKIKFFSETPGIELGPNDTFTLNTSDRPLFAFRAEITVDCRAQRGQVDLVTITLLDSEGRTIGKASARDSIFVTRSAMAPRVHIPMILNNAP